LKRALDSAILAMLLALAACAGATAPPVSPQGATPAATAPPPPAQPASGAPPAPSATAPATAPAPAATNEAVEMKGPVPTAMADDLRALGLDAARLPPIEQLDARALRGVMKLFARSLGVRCGDCHEQGDFSAPTPRKKIAAKMWNEFVAKLSLRAGSPLFCDSCHQGRLKQLDRRDLKALSKWMDGHFVDELARIDGHPHDCETCHVDMEMHLLALWSR
jgi:hypothetical protein